MKKILFFLVALTTVAITFSACENNKAGDPLKGTWSYTTQPTESGWYSKYVAIFDGKGGFEFQDYAFGPEATEAHDCNYMKGQYEIKGDIVTIHYLEHGWIHDGQRDPVQDFEPFDEQIQFKISGNKLTITRYYGTPDAYQEVYTKQ